jgi:hypothetical protein
MCRERGSKSEESDLDDRHMGGQGNGIQLRFQILLVQTGGAGMQR